jgi:hypothetical protein
MSNSNNSINIDSSDAEAQANTSQVSNSASVAPKAPRVQKRPKNALIHGIYAEELVLPWESANDLKKLRDEIWAELGAEGRLEEETVLGIVYLNWLKRRAMRTAQLASLMDPFELAIADSHIQDFDGVVDAVKSGRDDTDSLSKSAKEAVESLTRAADKINEITVATISGHNQEGQAKEAFTAAQAAQHETNFMKKILNGQVFPRMCALEDAYKSAPGSVSQKRPSYEHIERVAQIVAKLDARIDKQLARLIHLQEYKRMRRNTTKVIGSSIVPAQVESP